MKEGRKEARKCPSGVWVPQRRFDFAMFRRVAAAPALRAFIDAVSGPSPQGPESEGRTPSRLLSHLSRHGHAPPPPPFFSVMQLHIIDSFDFMPLSVPFT